MVNGKCIDCSEHAKVEMFLEQVERHMEAQETRRDVCEGRITDRLRIKHFIAVISILIAIAGSIISYSLYTQTEVAKSVNSLTAVVKVHQMEIDDMKEIKNVVISIDKRLYKAGI